MNALSTAQQSLALLESQFVQFCQEEQNEIEACRYLLRSLISKYDSSMKLAIIAAGFEIAISEKQ